MIVNYKKYFVTVQCIGLVELIRLLANFPLTDTSQANIHNKSKPQFGSELDATVKPIPELCVDWDKSVHKNPLLIWNRSGL